MNNEKRKIILPAPTYFFGSGKRPKFDRATDTCFDGTNSFKR